MTFTWLNNGLDWVEQLKLNKTEPSNLTLHLYTNDYTPVVTDTAEDYTECELTGYDSITLTPDDWTGSTTDGLSTYTYPSQSWTFSSYAGGTTIYGAYLTNGAGVAVAAALLDTAFAVPAAGGTLNLSLTDTNKQC
jgi:hypothetical protein